MAVIAGIFALDMVRPLAFRPGTIMATRAPGGRPFEDGVGVALLALDPLVTASQGKTGHEMIERLRSRRTVPNSLECRQREGKEQHRHHSADQSASHQFYLCHLSSLTMCVYRNNHFIFTSLKELLLWQRLHFLP